MIDTEHSDKTDSLFYINHETGATFEYARELNVHMLLETLSKLNVSQKPDKIKLIDAAGKGRGGEGMGWKGREVAYVYYQSDAFQ